MNQVSLSSTAGKLFWASLFAYCVAFSGFYFNTQYTLSRIDYEEQHGVFLGFKGAICGSMGENCNDIKFVNYLIDSQRKYITYVDIHEKKKQPIDIVLLQRNYHEFMGRLPWYIRMQFGSSMEIKTINGKPFKVN